MATVNEAQRTTPFTSTAVHYENSITNVTEGQILISDEALWYMNVCIFILLCGTVSIFGTLSNTCNLIIFYRLELKDSMSVCLLALSCTDFLLSFIITVGRACPIWNIFYNDQGVDPMALLYAGPSWAADSLFLCSGWILTFLSLERCVCVIFPFKVKDIFTRNRSIVAVILIFVITVSIDIPIYRSHSLQWISQKATAGNETRLIRRLAIVLAANRHQVEATQAVLNSIVVPVPSLVLTLGSVVWMIYGLNSSAKLRDSMTSTKNTRSAGRDNDDAQGTRLTQKTRKLVKVVLLLAMIFFICSLPRMSAKAINTLYPEVNEGRKGENVNNFMWQSARLFAAFNASVNIFVYLKINSSYQTKFRELFSFRSQQKQAR